MSEKNTFAVCIPTLNRIDLLLPAMMYYIQNMPQTKFFIYDNGKQNIEDKLVGIRNVRGCRNLYRSFENVTVFGGVDKNIGVSAAWNILITEAFEKQHTHALVLNDDICINLKDFEI